MTRKTPFPRNDQPNGEAPPRSKTKRKATSPHAPTGNGWSADQLGDAYEGEMPFEASASSDGATAPATHARPDEAASANEMWPDPRPLANELPAVLPFKYEMLPDTFAPFVSDVAERMETPPEFTAVPLMIALGAVVGKKVCIRSKRLDDWLVVPNLWGAIIGRPGIMKTPSIRPGLRFLWKLEKEYDDEFNQQKDDYLREKARSLALNKKRSAAFEKAVQKGGDGNKEWEDIPVSCPTEPHPRRLMVNDCTVEKLADLQTSNSNGLLVNRDELMALFAALEREGQENGRQHYIEGWDGLQPLKIDRMSRGTSQITHNILSVFGGIQPGKLAAYLRGAVDGGFRDDGLIQRFQLAVYPDVVKDYKGVDRLPDFEWEDKTWGVFQAMDKLTATDVGAREENGIAFLHFDDNAQELFNEWRKNLELLVRSGREHPAIESHLAKYRSLMPSLALLIHLANGGKGPVTAEATRRALLWMPYLESHARRMYSIITDPGKASAKALALRIAEGEVQDRFTTRSVYRHHWGHLDKQGTEDAVELLLELNWLKEAEIATGGKPLSVYRIHPAKMPKG